MARRSINQTLTAPIQAGEFVLRRVGSGLRVVIRVSDVSGSSVESLILGELIVPIHHLDREYVYVIEPEQPIGIIKKLGPASITIYGYGEEDRYISHYEDSLPVAGIILSDQG